MDLEERAPRIQPSHRPQQWFTVRVRNPRSGSHSHAWCTVDFVVIACKDFSPPNSATMRYVFAASCLVESADGIGALTSFAGVVVNVDFVLARPGSGRQLCGVLL